MSVLTLDGVRGACRLCDSTIGQRPIGREWLLGRGQWFVRCGACGGGYLDPDLTEASQARFYETDYRRLYTAEAAAQYDDDFLTSIRVRGVADWRVARLADRVPPGGAVLEVGSGYGGFLGRLHAARPDIGLTAVEPDIAHRTAALDGAPVRFVDRLEGAAGPFDLIAIFHALEHVRDPQATLSHARSRLTSGGRIAVEVPDAGAPWSGWQDVHAAHLSYFTGPSLDRLCQRAGLADAPADAPLSGTLWRELTLQPTTLPPAADGREISAVDRHFTQYHGRWRDRVKRRLKRIAVMLLGAEAVGARQRRRFGPAIDRELGLPPRRARLFGLPVDPLTMADMLSRAEEAMRTHTPLRHTDINVAKLVAARDLPALRADIVGSDLVTVDGMGVYWAAGLLAVTLPERIAGIDLMERLIARCADSGFRPYILGAKPDVLKAGVERLQDRHPTLTFAGWHHGYFTLAEEPALVTKIAAAKADCLFVAMPSPAKEAFLARNHQALGVPFVMGVGGSVDVIAGLRWRAPRWMQRAGLEWFARMIQEPRRLGPRYLSTNLRFAGLVLRELARRQ